MIQVGFTGTQQGMTDAQKTHLHALLLSIRQPAVFHHGCCIGSDHEAHIIARAIGFRMHFHPPIKHHKTFNWEADILKDDLVEPRGEFLDRDRDIVDAVFHMFATPKDKVNRVRSGTWYTIRYAAKQKRDLTIIWPTGHFGTVEDIPPLFRQP